MALVCILSYSITDPPTNLQLDMNTEATEGDLITINCTVESFPLSQFTLTRKSEPRFSPEWNFQSSHNQQLNKLSYTVKATGAHTGFYTCKATNTEGSLALQKKLVVKCKWLASILIGKCSRIFSDLSSVWKENKKR